MGIGFGCVIYTNETDGQIGASWNAVKTHNIVFTKLAILLWMGILSVGLVRR